MSTPNVKEVKQNSKLQYQNSYMLFEICNKYAIGKIKQEIYCVLRSNLTEVIKKLSYSKGWCRWLVISQSKSNFI